MVKLGNKLVCAALLSSYCFNNQEAFSQNKSRSEDLPNVLCIVCEDISPYLGCYGDVNARTPNLDRLAESSVRYTNMHTTVGVSSPSRFALITGMYPSSCGANFMRTMGNSEKYMPEGIRPYEVVTPPEVKCYSEFMRRAGYYCVNGPKTDYQFKAPESAWDECGGDGVHWKNRPEGKPFFAIFNLGVTHESQLWERADKPLAVNPDSLSVPEYLPDTPTVRRDLAIMYSNIYEMDCQVGSLIEEVKEAGLLDNTIIIWYSDNGGPIPRGKREIYISGTRVPFMLRYPDGYRAGDVEDRLCMFVDIPATIMSLVGLKPPKYMHGKPFAGKFEKKERKVVYAARDRMDACTDKQAAVFDGRYHLIHNYMPEKPDFLDNEYQNNLPTIGEMKRLYSEGKLKPAQAKWFTSPRPDIELYDILSDPYELENLAGQEKYADIQARLDKEYRKWMRKYNSAWFIPEIESFRSFYPDGIQRTTANPEIEVRKHFVKISSATEGASIVYRIKGVEKGKCPETWHLYSGPLHLPDGSILEAKAVRIGFRDSETVSKEI
ncbi:MAG: sulfatase-like hydrolase/transferase [Bacteroidetes bacterium]|uniref:Sulfatase-like hydrolase/transferase n=1 Tax=Candidatus Cryptobacteroides faecigallinarum TaxID=2840763 RepID=A0A9D9NHT4_9BACT|nr:sulfatase-like hydrolase/transferase [Candidatus Cryptobacteroides faecigallinarum]